MKIALNKPLYDLSNATYHGLPNTYSSTQLKDLLHDDGEYFYRKHVTKEFARESNAAFDIGTYFHTAILEPEKLESECVVFPGAMRRGKVFDDFAAKHPGKVILSNNDLTKAQTLVDAVDNSEVARSVLQNGRPEVSLLVRLFVNDRGIFVKHKTKGVFQLTRRFGWMRAPEVSNFAGFVELIVRVRADFLSAEKGEIVDLKSTSGDAKDARSIAKKVSEYNYDLSAALYLDLFSLTDVKFPLNFLWVFASKDFGNCRVWRASKESIIIGRIKWATCVEKLAHQIQNGWDFPDYISEFEPSFFDREYLNKKTLID